MAKLKVYMGITSTGDRVDNHTYLFELLREQYGDRVELVFPKKCIHRFGHDFARNEVISEFLETNCDVLWFLDSDVCPPPAIFELLTTHYDKWEHVAGAQYPLWMNIPNSLDKAVFFTSYKRDAYRPGLYQSSSHPELGIGFVDALATGCLFIKRKTFALLERPYFQFIRDPHTMEVLEGEDLGFARKLNLLGIKFFCDSSIICRHYKKVDLLDTFHYALNIAKSNDVRVKQEVETALKNAAMEGYNKGRSDKESGEYSHVSGLEYLN